MNDKQRARELFRKLDSTQGSHKYGCIRIHKESREHFDAKCNKAWEIHELGHKVGTELKTVDGDIYDVCDMTTGEHWEFERNPKEDKHRGERVQLEKNDNI